ncbi:hypothetical protein, partial [Desulfoscipio geothermicus]
EKPPGLSRRRLCGRQPALDVGHPAERQGRPALRKWQARQRVHLARSREGRDGGERGNREVPIRSVQVESATLNAKAAG